MASTRVSEEVLRATYGRVKRKYDFEFDLKSEQVTLISSVLNGKNAIGFLPTGYGKTMGYVMPPLLLDEIDPSRKHIVLVISPLISLMIDQVTSLKRKGISAAYITRKQDMDPEVLEDIKQAKFSIVYSSPEAAVNKSWVEVFQTDQWQSRMCLFAVDESHCISEWGESFRQEYRQLYTLRSVFQVPVMALTATVTSQVYGDIAKYLLISQDTSETKIIAILPDRPNIFLKIETSNKDQKENIGWLIESLREMNDRSKKTIIYCRSINMVADLYQFLCDELGTDKYTHDYCMVAMFHASVDDIEKGRITDEFSKTTSKIRCVISTIAFGIGIDIPDVDYVIHCGAPKSVLCYWQGVGRCARDGRQGVAILYATPHSLHRGRTSEEMILICKDRDSCLRNNILKNVSIKEMDSGMLVKEKEMCRGCIGACACEQCTCCNFCFDKCQCAMKRSSDIE